MARIALVGVSGVGKTTLLREIAKSVDFCHLEAGELIASENERDLGRAVDMSTRNLRRVMDDQEALVSAFGRRARSVQSSIVLAGHTLIETVDGLLSVPASIFRELDVDCIFFLQDGPENIFLRRSADKDRSRPTKNIFEIEHIQNRALICCAEIARSLSVTMFVITPDVYDELQRAVENRI